VTQIPAELDALIALFTEHDVRSYLEVGCKAGATFDRVLRSLPPGSVGVAVDLPGGPWGHPSTVTALRQTCQALDADGWVVAMILGDSADPDTIASVASAGPFDAVLIDADHRYEAVEADWRHYGPLARLVAFHDIAAPAGHVSAKTGLPVEVPRLWAEIKASGRRTVEFVVPGSLMGIGVVLPEG
jgi:predicted O-methyltransferase YrrM